ncbi:MAG TPA: hypothetical protein PKW35_20160 [Nannocystaceae bacterium]|nr:hypothetical protein [Nannocystaceae bacterium]
MKRTLAWLFLPLAIALLAAGAAVGGEDVKHPCGAFLLRPGVELRERPSVTAKVTRSTSSWTVALPHPGHVYISADIVRVSASEKPDDGAGCFQRDFTVEGDWLRVWVSPEDFTGESAWVKVADAEAFSYPYPGKWRAQDPNLTLRNLSAAAAKAIADGKRAMAQRAAPSSIRETFGGPQEAIWAAILEGLLLSGWQVETADRSAGLVSTKKRSVPARTVTTCTRTNDDEEDVTLSLVTGAVEGRVEVRAVLSFRDIGACRSRGVLEEEVLARIRGAVGDDPTSRGGRERTEAP